MGIQSMIIFVTFIFVTNIGVGLGCMGLGNYVTIQKRHRLYQSMMFSLKRHEKLSVTHNHIT